MRNGYGVLDGLQKGHENQPTLPSIMEGEVVNTNDPQQMGRIQVHLTSAHNDYNLTTDNSFFPWVNYAAPFGGMDQQTVRGPGKEGQDWENYGSKTVGGVAYGLWAIPKVGARVLICAVDGDPSRMFWFGCVYPNSTPHTLPHGRYSTRFPGGDEGPEGPLSTKERPIEPLYSNLEKAFDGKTSYEWRSRGADYQVAGINTDRQSDESDVSGTHSKTHDTLEQTLKEKDGKTVGQDLKYRQGYGISRTDQTKKTDTDDDVKRNRQTDKNMESHVVSLTSPGFHSLSMDDRPENGRVRLRTSTGHQILLDDTNERIYVSTNEGRNWIEMDSDGHIYVYSQESISVRAEGDLNLTAEKTVRISGKEGVHIESKDELRVHAVKDMYIRGDAKLFEEFTSDINVRGGANMNTTIVQNVDFKSTTNHVEVSAEFDVQSGSTKFNSGGVFEVGSAKFDLDSVGNMKNSGALHSVKTIVSSADIVSSTQSLDSLFNHTHGGITSGPGSTAPFGVAGVGPTIPSSVSPVAPAEAYTFINDKTDLAFWTNVTPKHEPWPRTFTKDKDVNLTHDPEYSVDDTAVGVKMKQTNNTDRKRGPLWHR